METITDSKLNPERLFPADPILRVVTRELYQEVKDLPLISPHGHTDPQWFASNQNFTNATELFLIPDHYLFRMLFSQGISLESLGITRLDGAPMKKTIETFGKPLRIIFIFSGELLPESGLSMLCMKSWVLNFLSILKMRM